MKKIYFLVLLFSCFSFITYSQTTVTVYATNVSPTAYTTGNSDGVARNANSISVVSNTQRGYAVFDLAAAGVPANATILSVQGGIYVNSTSGGAAPVCNTYGFSGDLSTVVAPATLFADMIPPATFPGVPAGSPLFATLYGGVPGDVIMPVTANAISFIQANVTVPGKVSLAYTTTAASTAVYDIQGESGAPTTNPTVPHAPYLIITYCAQPTGVSAIAAPNPVCYGSTLTLTGAGDSVTDWSWTGPNGFTSTMQSPTVTGLPAAAGVYTLIVSNVCGATINSVTVTTAAVTITPGPITGITNAWVGFTTQLSDPTPGGVWTSSNPAVATVGVSTGTVYGVSPGSVVITYTTPSGCVFTTNVLIVQSVFSQIPLIDPGAIGLGFPIVAWYPFCGDTLDHSFYPIIGGHDLLNHGATTTPAVLTTDRFGIPNNAYQYDGVSTMMQYTTFFPISGPTGDFTYSCWFEADSEQNSIILYNGTFGTDGWGFVINDGTLTNAGNKVGVDFLGTLFLPTVFTMNRWHNVMLKKNGNSYNFYLDNVSIGFFISPVLTTPPISGVFALGIDYTSTVGAGPLDKVFKGKIDDIAIYNRQLNAAERDSLYNFNPDARVFSLGNDTTICVDSILLVPTPPTIGNRYEWMAGSSVIFGATDSILKVHPLAGPAGNVYTLIVGKPYGCLTSDAITIYNAPIPVNVGPPIVNICIGDTVTLADASFPTCKFLWSTGDTAHSITVTTSGIYSVDVDSVYHYGPGASDTTTCVGHDTVTVNAYPVPIIGLPVSVARCTGIRDTLIPVYDTAYKYEWHLIGFPSVISTDSAIIDSITGNNVFWVKVTDGQCSRTDTVSVLIVYDTLTFLATDTAICLGQSWPPPGQFLVTNNFIANYQWTPTAGIATSNIYDPIIIPDTSATYIMRVTYPGCPDIVDSFHLDVQPNPLIFLGNNRMVCQYDSLHFVAQVSPSWYTHYRYSWTPTTFLDSINTPNVIFTADTAIDTEMLFITVTTPAGCIGKDSVQLVVHPSSFDSLIVDTTLCPGDSIRLQPTLTAFAQTHGITPSAYIWSPRDYLDDSTSFAPMVHPEKSIQYRMIGINQYGCRDTLSASINVSPAAVLNLGDSVTIYPGESYEISPQTNCVTFQWFPPLGLDNDKVSNPVATPEINTKYYVWAATEAGCKINDSISIRVDAGNYITLANAFTPGAGVNNKFYVFKRGLLQLKYFRIYDRWGDKVFETTNIDEGWDGTFNGKPQPFGVYVYEVEAIAVDNKVYDRVGNVTLLR